ncbi:MAG TPA: hypothetical protein VHL10_10150, partial [Nitrososphaera sp.]|nr:hypothetical protein [Nitrososphaera sp.]
QTSKNLMDEMSKIVRVVKPDVKLFIGDALAGNDTINQAREFFQYATFDGAILTKIDADAKGGAAMSIAYITSKPITFVGVGQGYDDLIPFDPDKFIESLFGSVGEVSVEHLMTMPQPPQSVIEEPEPEKEPVVEEKKEEEKLPAPKPQVAASPAGIFAPKVEQKVEPQQKPELKIVPPVQQYAPVIREPEPAKEEKKKVEYTPPKETPTPQPLEVEQPKEKKGRFGLFGKKKSDEDRKKEEDEKRRREEQRAKEEEERTKAEEEERQKVEKEKEEKKKKRKEDKDTEQEEDKVIYLTDEDIEDLLK